MAKVWLPGSIYYTQCTPNDVPGKDDDMVPVYSSFPLMTDRSTEATWTISFLDSLTDGIWACLMAKLADSAEIQDSARFVHVNEPTHIE